MFNLHVIQSKHGDCFVLEFCSNGKNPKYILIDGGPSKVYEDYLSKFLKDKVKSDKLELIIVSHVDNDHIVGIIKLLDDRFHNKDKVIKVKDIWFNSLSHVYGLSSEIIKAINECFNKIISVKKSLNIDISYKPLGPDRSYREATELVMWASTDKLNLEVNRHFEYIAATSNEAKASIVFDNVELKVIGPSSDDLIALGKKWMKWLNEKCPDIKRLVKRKEMTIENLSSIMFLAIADKGTVNEKTILFTGDGYKDDIIRGLQKLYPGQETFFVDVLKVPHHGSDKNVDLEFFEIVKAKKYVLTGNHGVHKNPELDTLKWIVEAAQKQEREIDIFVTTKTPYVEGLLDELPPDKNGYTLEYLKKGKISEVLEL